MSLMVIFYFATLIAISTSFVAAVLLISEMLGKFAFLVLILGTNGQYHHEGDYWATLDRSSLVFHNSSYLKDVKHYLGFFNRTLKTINFEFTLLHNLTKDLTLEAQVYKLMSNEYRFFPVTLRLNLCEEYRKNSFGLKNMLDKYSNIKSCPINQGSYHIHDALVEVAAYPPFIPGGQYKIQEKYLHKSDLLFEINTFYTVTEILKIWKG